MCRGPQSRLIEGGWPQNVGSCFAGNHTKTLICPSLSRNGRGTLGLSSDGPRRLLLLCPIAGESNYRLWKKVFAAFQWSTDCSQSLSDGKDDHKGNYESDHPPPPTWSLWVQHWPTGKGGFVRCANLWWVRIHGPSAFRELKMDIGRTPEKCPDRFHLISFVHAFVHICTLVYY